MRTDYTFDPTLGDASEDPQGMGGFVPGYCEEETAFLTPDQRISCGLSSRLDPREQQIVAQRAVTEMAQTVAQTKTTATKRSIWKWALGLVGVAVVGYVGYRVIKRYKPDLFSRTMMSNPRRKKRAKRRQVQVNYEEDGQEVGWDSM
jgi:hypothetical protein